MRKVSHMCTANDTKNIYYVLLGERKRKRMIRTRTSMPHQKVLVNCLFLKAICLLV